MQEVAWIFGSSAAGKETFIKHAVSIEESEIRSQLGWANKKVVGAPASLEYISHFSGDPIAQKRELILSEVPALLKSADVVLIKWQGLDSKARRVERLRSIIPEISHRIIRLAASDEVVRQRLPLKKWWKDSTNIADWIADENYWVTDCINVLGEDYPVTTISSNSNRYTVISEKN